MTSPVYGIAPEGYRLPAETQLGAVRLQISDLARSLDYYTRTLGFRVISQSEGRATLGAEGSDEVMIELRELRGARAVPRRGLLGLYHFAILLPDRPALGRFLAHLIGLGITPGMSDHLVSEALYLSDPDGLGIEVYADRARADWKHADKQLTMATNPLDARSVIASANGESWSGMPRGTKVGHVHLYVGDIGDAEAFYHRGLGLDKIVWSYPGALFLSAGGYHHHLGTNTWAAGAPPATDDDARLLEWTVVVPSLEDAKAAAANIRAQGYNVTDSDGTWTATDPWGTTLRLTP
ncbi:MAG TPA: VOC family protein [Gemmatimonadaceae bacterium]|nr:VOC family protein [Gemmatimonadaceae bacterium]